jgi:predicted transposase YbfD/YdcC
MIFRYERLDALVGYLETISDPRDDRGKRHRLIDIFVMTIFGCLWGHTDFTNMARELRYHEEYFTELLGLENGIPSHDTFSAVFSLIDPIQFLECFISWLCSVADCRRQHVAIDGKAVRAACDKVHDKRVPYLLNAYMVEQGLCIGQIRVDEKTNEIVGIPELLEWLDLEGSVVTIDAIGCQKDITETLVRKGAHFVLPVKDNQPTLHDDIETEMRWLVQEKAQQDKRYVLWKQRGSDAKELGGASVPLDEFVQTDKGHSRIERRTYYTCDNVRSVDIGKWPSVAAAGMVIRERMPICKDGEGDILAQPVVQECETYILSRPMGAEEFSCYARGHWGIENSLHWVLDDYFREDRCTARRGHATENLGLLRKTVFNLMKLDKDVEKLSMKGKQIHYRNDHEAVERLLFETIPYHHKKEQSVQRVQPT